MPMRIRVVPDLEELSHVLDYDRDTGIFRWKQQVKYDKPVGSIAGTVRRFGYVYIGVCGSGQFAAHRLAWMMYYGHDPVGEVDHIDGNPSNNSIKNLRLASSSEQKQNKCVQSNNRSGLKGAYYHTCHKGKKWRSQIKTKDGLVYLGYYHTAEEAHAAYGRAAMLYFGKFAKVS